MIVDRLGEKDADELITVFKKAYPKRNPVDLLFLDSCFRAPSVRYAQMRAADGGKVWTYMYALDSSMDGGRVPWHSVDIPLMFNNADSAPAVWNAGYTETAQEMITTSLGRFCHTGDPSTEDLCGWGPVTSESVPTMIMEEGGPRLGIDYDKELLPELVKYEEKLGNGYRFSFATDI